MIISRTGQGKRFFRGAIVSRYTAQSALLERLIVDFKMAVIDKDKRAKITDSDKRLMVE